LSDSSHFYKKDYINCSTYDSIYIWVQMDLHLKLCMVFEKHIDNK